MKGIRLKISLCLTLIAPMSMAADNTSQQIQMLNSQIQAQLQTMQAAQQKQLTDLNKRQQEQMKQMQAALDEKVTRLNTQIQAQIKTMQTNLQQQIQQVQRGKPA